jgi:hypothetical protein
METVQEDSMRIQFLYYEDCPSHEDGLARLKQAMADIGISAEIEIVKVETDEQAKALQFVGSPTFRIEGKDLFPPSADAYYSLTCRAYFLDDGRISPLPTLAMLRSALEEIVQFK